MEGKQKRLLEEETELNSRQEVQSDTVCLEIRNEMPASSLMYCTLSLEPMLSVPDFNFSPKLQDKVRNGKPGFKARCTPSLQSCFYRDG